MSELKKRAIPLKTLLLIGAIAGSLYVGDKYKPFTQLNERSFYYNSSVEDGFYQNPMNLDVVTARNAKNRIEVYLVDGLKQDSFPIQENMHVGTSGECIDDFFDDVKLDTQNWWEKQNSDSTKLMYKIKNVF